MGCYRAIDDDVGRRRAAERVAQRSAAAIVQDPTNAAALGLGAPGLFVIGETKRAKEWIQRASLMDTENHSTLYNLGCVLALECGDEDASLEMFERYFERLNSRTVLKHV